MKASETLPLAVANDRVPLPFVVNTCPLLPSDTFNSDIPTEFAAISLAPTASVAIFAAVTELFASFAEVTFKSAILEVVTASSAILKHLIQK